MRKTKTVSKSTAPGRVVLGAAIIAGLTAVAFLPSLENGFTNWDDSALVTENPDIRALTPHNLAKVFSSRYQGNYQPLAMLTYMAERALFDLDPTAYHATNVALHLANGLLVFALVHALSGSLLVGLLVGVGFAVHPLRVESVAWIAERKDVLSAFFFLSSLLLYLRFKKDGSRRSYGLCALALLCSLLAKPMAVSQPLVLLCIDYLRGRKIDRAAIVTKIPFFALAALFAAIALRTQTASHTDPGFIPIASTTLQRMGVPFYGLVFYVVKSAIPVHLCASYPFPAPGDAGMDAQLAGAALLVVVVAATVYRFRARSRALVFGALFYVITAMPILQIVPVGVSKVAERYSYIPVLGLLFVCATFVQHLVQRPLAGNRLAKRVLAIVLTIAGGIGVVVLCLLTRERCAVWKDSLSLWTDVIDKHPNALAYNNRGIASGQQGAYRDALDDLNRALALNPGYALAYFNRGNVYRRLGDFDRSVDDYTHAMEHSPGYTLARYYRGITYCFKGDYDRGIADLTEIIAADPANAEALLNRGLAYARKNDRERAGQDFATACGLGYGAACAQH